MTLSDVHACRPTFLAPTISRSESLVFELVVNDGQTDSPPDITHVLVTAYNDPPVADAGPNQTVDRGALVSLSGEKSSDPNGDPLTYAWSQTAGTGVTLNGGNTSDPYFLAPYLSSDETLGFRLTVRDSVSSASASVSVTVRATTSPLLGAPLISNFNPSSGLPGVLATVEGSNFVAANSASNKVFFNGTLAAVRASSATTITVMVPEEATSGLIKVVTPFGDATSVSSFTVLGQEVSEGASRLSTAAAALSGLLADPLSGAAITRIPIVVPPGRQGLQPDLALHYRSGGGNGWAGVGWDLHLSYIQRSTKQGKPAYNNTDTFIVNVPGARLNLDNVELVKISDTEYRARIESAFARFVFNGTSWEATQKDGTRYLFGSDTGRATNAFGTFRWYLDKVVDTNGNTMTLAYAQDQEERYLSRIAYTGNEQIGDAPKYSVDFITEARPDAASSYVSGARVVTAKRLAQIVV